MAFRAIKLTVLKLSDPKAWKKKVLAAHKKHRTNAAAAEALGVSVSTLMRWIRSLRAAGSPVLRHPRSEEKWKEARGF